MKNVVKILNANNIKFFFLLNILSAACSNVEKKVSGLASNDTSGRTVGDGTNNSGTANSTPSSNVNMQLPVVPNTGAGQTTNSNTTPITSNTPTPSPTNTSTTPGTSNTTTPTPATPTITPVVGGDTTTTAVSAVFDGGNGTEASPYLISRASQLQATQNIIYNEKFFKLTSDINFANEALSLENQSNYVASQFVVGLKLDGNNHKISGIITNLNVRSTYSSTLGADPMTTECVGGLFSNSLEIKNLKIENIRMTVKNELLGYRTIYVGALVGCQFQAGDKKILNVSVSGSLNVQSNATTKSLMYYVGGIGGTIYSCENCKSSVDTQVTVTNTASASGFGVWVYAGGAAGDAYNLSKTSSHGSVNVSLFNNQAQSLFVSVGGLASIVRTEARDCFSRSNVKASLRDGELGSGGGSAVIQAAGLVPHFYGNKISRVYSSGRVDSENLIGGSKIESIYNLIYSGQMGRQDSMLSMNDLYWDLDSSEIPVAFRRVNYGTEIEETLPYSTAGTPLREAEMSNPNNFKNWDFINTWQMSAAGYPVLRDQ